MNRYTHSFSITSVLYALIFIFVFINAKSFNIDKTKEENILKIQTITETKIATIQKIQPHKIQQKIAKPEPIKQEIVQPMIAKPIIETPKPSKQEVIEEKTIITQNIPKEVVKQQVVEQPKQTPIVVAPKIVEHKVEHKQEIKVDNTPIKQQFFAKLKEKINSNKSYPQNARRRGIEGVVEVKFEILSSGQVGTISILSGNQIFFQSIKDAIESSFPMAIPTQIKDNLGFVTLRLEYKLL